MTRTRSSQLPWPRVRCLCTWTWRGMDRLMLWSQAKGHDTGIWPQPQQIFCILLPPKQHLDVQLSHWLRGQSHSGMSTLCSMEVIDVGSKASYCSTQWSKRGTWCSLYGFSGLECWLTTPWLFYARLTGASTIKILAPRKWKWTAPSYSANTIFKAVCSCKSPPLSFGTVSAKPVCW